VVVFCSLQLVFNANVEEVHAQQSPDEIVSELDDAVDYRAHVLVKVKVESDVQKQAFDRFVKQSTAELDLWQEGPVHKVIRLAPQVHSALKRIPELPHQVLHSDVQQLIEETAAPAGDTFFDKYHDVDTVQKHMQDVASAHEEISLSTLGKSVEGRPIQAMHVAKKGLPEDAPEVIILSGQHAREWIGPAATLFAAQELVKAAADTKGQQAHTAAHAQSMVQVSQLLQNTRFTFIPLMNPDGYHHTHASDRMWRKNRRVNKQKKCVGIDTNRNWAFHFGKTMAADGTVHPDTNDSCSSVYEGSHAFSEPEPAAVAHYIQGAQKQHRRVKAFLDVHSYSQKVLPPGCNGYPIQKDAHQKLLQAAHKVSAAMSGNRYQSGECAALMYPCSGVAHDWVYSSAGVPTSLAVELRPDESSSTGFLLPADQIKPTGAELYRGVVALAQAAM
jgi:murein tripeptide amidase MpaA